MKTTTTLPGFLLLLILVCTAGCIKTDYTHYYADPETPGTAIFSNTGNNLLSCIFDGRPWRSADRTDGSYYTNELNITLHKTNGPLDTLSFVWVGASGNQNNFDIGLNLPVAKNFQRADFAALQGKRMVIDSSNGFFALSSHGFTILRGRGSIYFNVASIVTGPYDANGKLAGLLEANFSDTAFHTIRSGRFDDAISDGMLINF